MSDNRPRGREKNVTGNGKSIYKRGSGTGTGPVGNGGGYSGRNSDNSNRGVSGSSSASLLSSLLGGGKSKKKLIIVVIIVVIVLLLGGNKISSLLSGLTSSTQNFTSFFNASSILSSLSSSTTSTGWTRSANTGTLNTNVASGAREKYTTIKGNGQDKITIMVYMCGTDLESGSGMASSDLSEMAKATIGSNVNLIVYTGGCKGWKTSGISNSTNQIYQITSGKMTCIEKDMGNKAMTKPDTLTEFITYCKTNYAANRYDLIFWDHGGGSLSGYGYDERFSTSGSMTLSGINTALKNAGVKFDFIGFDACLMATAENALMLTSYADYLIASEETEPGIGWYYTDWLTELSSNTSMSTLEIGKNIADDFTDMCAKKLSSAKTTLSVIDLAELAATIPDGLSSFATSTTKLIQSDNYQTVSDARSNTREFATSSKIDQVDLVNLADNIGTTEAKALSEIILSCVKYNRTSSSMTNCYGLSIYFPYNKVSKVDSAISTYDAIGLDDEYSKCIKSFAQLETAGQVTTSSTSSPLSSLTGSLFSGSGISFDTSSISSLLSGFLGSTSDKYMSDMDVSDAASYISGKTFDATKLVWEQNSDGEWVLNLSEDQWKLVHSLTLNVFYDDGEGYIDLGLDNTFDWNDDGQLIGTYDGTWIAINGQPVPYYYMDTVESGKNYTITGYVPVLLNGQSAKLILTFTDSDPYGSVTSVEYTYNGETETVAKNDYILKDGDTIDFVCDYYKYDGTYEDSYLMGDQLIVDGELVISNVTIDSSKADATYRFTDIYNQVYWSQSMK